MKKVKQFFRDMFLFPDPLTLAVLKPPRPKGTFRLWDREFNLLATWQEDVDLCITWDQAGEPRRGGAVSRIDWV